jgi:hypothetical protein
VEAEAGRREIPAERRLLNRTEMLGALQSAAAVAVPSGMESLSFSLGEALLLGKVVYATPLLAHREIARRMGRAPIWLDMESHGSAPEPRVFAPTLLDGFRDEWRALGVALGLPTSEAESP